MFLTVVGFIVGYLLLGVLVARKYFTIKAKAIRSAHITSLERDIKIKELEDCIKYKQEQKEISYERIKDLRLRVELNMCSREYIRLPDAEVVEERATLIDYNSDKDFHEKIALIKIKTAEFYLDELLGKAFGVCFIWLPYVVFYAVKKTLILIGGFVAAFITSPAEKDMQRRGEISQTLTNWKSTMQDNGLTDFDNHMVVESLELLRKEA